MLAIAEKARAERLFMSFGLALAISLVLIGTALIIAGAGDHLDILVRGDGGLEARFVNASPGVAMCIIAAAIFWVAKPRQLHIDAAARDRVLRMRFGVADEGKPSASDAPDPRVARKVLDD